MSPTVQTRLSGTAVETPSSIVSDEMRLVSLMSADECRLLPEANLICELINGELVMAPARRTRHQLVVGHI